MNCINCDRPLEEVFSGSGKAFQFVDALDIQLHLGYGQFRDQGMDQDGAPRACFCKICAFALAASFPGIQKMLDNEKTLDFEWPFPCPGCDEGFMNYAVWRNHILLFHKGDTRANEWIINMPRTN